MKTYKKSKILLVLVLLPLLWSCDKALEEKPKTFFTEETFYQTEQDAILAVNGIYETLGGGASNRGWEGVYFSNYWTVTALTSDEGDVSPHNGNPNYRQLPNFSYGPTNEVVLNVWSDFYVAINAANLALQHIPNIEMDKDLKNRLLGEASFMRGLFYFELVRLFGEVPLVLEGTKSFEDSSYEGRTPIAEIYGQIVADFTFAEQNLPPSFTGADNGRPTAYSAKAYLAKVYLTQGIEYQAAKSKLEDIINSGQFALWDDYADVFKIANNNGKEVVYSINFDSQGTGLDLIWEGAHLTFRTLPLEYRSIGVNAGDLEIPTEHLYEQFDDLDRRKEVTFITEDIISGVRVTFNRPHIGKYWDRIAEPKVNNTGNDLQLIRYADVLLMYAEVLNEMNNGPTNDALIAINEIRKRARYADGAIRDVLPDLGVGLTYQEFKDALLEERFKEFVWEGQRWFDLVRFDQFVEKVKEAKPNSAVRPENQRLPIPQRERDVNKKLTQNDGY